MIRYFLAEGDRAGEAVIDDGVDSVTCSDPPPRVRIATLGMRTYCYACKREGYIAPHGPRWPGTAPNGKQWALSGDINICDCNPPPVFYAERGMSMTFTAEDVAALTGSRANSTASRMESAQYDQQFTLHDGNGRVLRDAFYTVRKRWPRAFGQFSEIYKWNVRGNHAADLIAGSVAKYASSGV